ncbi:hypothetical protein G9466_15435 [Halorussus sp. JP-T4]|nr:hypothetical protein [Halorussus sp. JP-T4]
MVHYWNGKAWTSEKSPAAKTSPINSHVENGPKQSS